VGATSPKALAEEVVARRADVGIALDGDGDRLVMVDHKGVVVDGDELLFIMAQEEVRQGRQPLGVVGTLMSNLGLEQGIEGMGLGFVRANVGDRYVMQELESRGWTLGGESSGHLICLDRTTTGDAIVAALAILGAMRSSGSKLSELTEGMVKYPQHMINVPCQNREDASHPSVQSTVREVEARLGSQGRVLLRPSGTEPLIRVMVEGAHQTLVEESAQVIADCVSSIGH